MSTPWQSGTADASARGWTECDAGTDCSAWTGPVRNFFRYWLSIAPEDRLPGRQHFDPLDIPQLMPRVWILDVVRDGDRTRFRYRLAGTKEVQTLKREVTGAWLDDVQPHLRDRPHGFARYHFMADSGRATYRRGPVSFIHDEHHRIVENCMVPMARDGRTVDMIAACSVLFYFNGTLTN